MLVGENMGKVSCLDYLKEKTLANGLQIKNMDIEYSVNLRETTLVIGHQFTNVFSCQRFPLHGSTKHCYRVTENGGLLPKILKNMWWIGCFALARIKGFGG